MRRILLLAGSFGPERVPARPSRDEPRWFEPLHVRDEAGARERIASQVAAGADVVVAPTWLTHRRALLPVGETRSARAWTAAAVRVAREGVELGLERREAALPEHEDPASARGGPQGGETHGPGPSIERPEPLVAAALPGLDEAPEPESGRLLPREAATERDYRDQAGLLADADPDLILVEGQPSVEIARLAVEEAASTGLPVWAAYGIEQGVGGDALDRLAGWLGMCGQVGCEGVLLPPSVEPLAELGRQADLRWGGLVGRSGEPPADAWLEAGAEVIGILDRAVPDAVAKARTTIDAVERGALEARARVEGRFMGHVARAAALAPGGAALWLGPEPRSGRPTGFDWLSVDAAEIRRLPTDHFRLVVAGQELADDALRDEPPALTRLGSLLEPGGILAVALRSPPGDHEGLHLLSIDDSADPPLALLRRGHR